ncbi:hypothetical protein ACOMHN_049279 [Nucella lapillus]
MITTAPEGREAENRTSPQYSATTYSTSTIPPQLQNIYGRQTIEHRHSTAPPHILRIRYTTTTPECLWETEIQTSPQYIASTYSTIHYATHDSRVGAQQQPGTKPPKSEASFELQTCKPGCTM